VALGSARGEWFIKAAIVLLGVKILFLDWIRYGGLVLVMVLMSFPICCSPFRHSGSSQRDLSVVASVGVSVSVATAGAIGAPAIYPTMVSAAI